MQQPKINNKLIIFRSFRMFSSKIADNISMGNFADINKMDLKEKKIILIKYHLIQLI